MLCLLPLLLAAVSADKLPSEPKDFVGTYARFDGFTYHEIKLEPKSKAFKQWRPDHAGDEDWSGTWELTQGIVRVQLISQTDGKKWSKDLVPLLWGDRLSLIEEDAIDDYVALEKRDLQRIADGRYGKDDTTQSRYAFARLDAKGHPAARFGTPITLKAFQVKLNVLKFPETTMQRSGRELGLPLPFLKTDQVVAQLHYFPSRPSALSRQ